MTPDIEIVEMDEMHSYIRHKKATVTVNRHGRRFIHFVIGDRSSRTASKLWAGIRDKTIAYVMTNY